MLQTGPAGLYKSATEQIKKAEEVKELRKTMVNEEVEWQEVGPRVCTSAGLMPESIELLLLNE